MDLKKNNRLEYLDIAIGISIILVALHHSSLKDLIPEFTKSLSLFRMPLFFFVSGIFFNPDKPHFFWKKTDALIKPYCVTSLLMILTPITLFNFEIFNEMTGILYGNGRTIRDVPLWFLPHLWLLQLIAYSMYRVLNFKNWNLPFKIVFFLFSLSLSFHLMKFFWFLPVSILGHSFTLPGLPLSSDFILFSLTFFLIGNFLKKQLIVYSPTLRITLFSIILFALINLLTNATLDLNNRILIEPLWVVAASAAGIYFIFSISAFFTKFIVFKKVLLWFGSSSMFILLFHYPIIIIFNRFDSSWMGFDTLFRIIVFVISIVVPVILGKVIRSNKLGKLLFLPIQ